MYLGMSAKQYNIMSLPSYTSIYLLGVFFIALFSGWTCLNPSLVFFIQNEFWLITLISPGLCNSMWQNCIFLWLFGSSDKSPTTGLSFPPQRTASLGFVAKTEECWLAEENPLPSKVLAFRDTCSLLGPDPPAPGLVQSYLAQMPLCQEARLCLDPPHAPSLGPVCKM